MLSTFAAKDRRSRAVTRRAALSAALVALALTAAFAAAQPAVGDDALAASIVEKADQIRFPAESFEAAVTIETTGTGDGMGMRKYRILSRGTENTIVMITEPASERGQIMLMKGHDLWVFLPNVSQPVRLSLSQRLTGQVANGDLARANFAGDYEAKLLRTEPVNGEAMHVLELTAKDRSVTYHRVVYWVRKADNRPYKAEFYSLSERLLKSCMYENFKRMAGKMRPTRLVMQDALRPDEKSTLEYTEIRLRDLPERMFTKDYLKRLE